MRAEILKRRYNGDRDERAKKGRRRDKKFRNEKWGGRGKGKW